MTAIKARVVAASRKTFKTIPIVVGIPGAGMFSAFGRFTLTQRLSAAWFGSFGGKESRAWYVACIAHGPQTHQTKRPPGTPRGGSTMVQGWPFCFRLFGTTAPRARVGNYCASRTICDAWLHCASHVAWPQRYWSRPTPSFRPSAPTPRPRPSSPWESPLPPHRSDPREALRPAPHCLTALHAAVARRSCARQSAAGAR